MERFILVAVLGNERARPWTTPSPALRERAGVRVWLGMRVRPSQQAL